MCDHVAMVRAGRLLAVQSVAVLAAQAPRQLRARYNRAPASIPARLINPKLEHGVLTAGIARDRIDVLRELLAGDGIEDLTLESQPLEETFLGLYGNAGHDPR